jgi:hypothetical protein
MLVDSLGRAIYRAFQQGCQKGLVLEDHFGGFWIEPVRPDRSLVSPHRREARPDEKRLVVLLDEPADTQTLGKPPGFFPCDLVDV